MGICLCLMPSNIETIEILKPKENKESNNSDNSFIGLADQSESEIRWVQLHQMFDR